MLGERRGDTEVVENNFADLGSCFLALLQLLTLDSVAALYRPEGDKQHIIYGLTPFRRPPLSKYATVTALPKGQF